jgi:hypothetical protein
MAGGRKAEREELAVSFCDSIHPFLMRSPKHFPKVTSPNTFALSIRIPTHEFEEIL